MEQPYRFERCELRPAERQLLIDGVPAPLGGRAFDVLVTLVERRDRVVSKTELFDTVWPGLVVEENNLQVQVSSLRKLLGPNAIATVPGRGYQFVAATDIARISDDSSAEARLHPNNLPHARTRFIGREAALADCTTLLRQTRLLTLSGIGGCGKTRLAQELAQRELARFPDGVWFVELGPLQEAQRVPAAVASTIGVQVGQLTEHLKDRHALVVMDNCEHVIGAATRSIETLLETCGALKIIATSREVLGTAGEQVFAVRSLSLPTTAELEEIRGSEAVRLFVDHARLVVPDFEIDDGNARPIAEICHRLDGIALAIELAAARVRILRVEDIRARLDNRFRLLTGGNRALPRHQTLHATMQWSYDLLTPVEQQLLRQLAVFAGGCTLAAVARVVGEHADEYDVLERLTALHDKSLVLVDRDTQAQPRYRLLETVRQYAEDRLNEAGESDEMRNRHLLHFVSLAEKMEPDSAGPGQAAWFDTMRNEQENLIAAHAWCAHAPDGGALAVRLIAASWRYWRYTSQPDRGYQLAQAALELPGADSDTLERCKTLLAMADFNYRMGRYEETRHRAEAGLALARRFGDTGLVIDGTTWLAVALHLLGDKAGALKHFERSCELARALDDNLRLGRALNACAELHRGAGDLATAERLYRESIRANPDDRLHAPVLSNLARVLIATGRCDEAQAALAQCRGKINAVGLKMLIECSIDVTAALASSMGEHATAARFRGAMERMLHEAHMRQDPIDEAFIAPWMDRSRAALGDEAFDAAKSAGSALSHQAAMVELDRWLQTVATKSAE